MNLDSTEDLTPAQEAAVEEFAARLDALQESATQREWLQITSRLDRNRRQIADDPHLRMLALAWLTGVRDHGGQRWDDLLDKTDAQLLDALGWPADLFAPTAQSDGE